MAPRGAAWGSLQANVCWHGGGVMLLIALRGYLRCLYKQVHEFVPEHPKSKLVPETLCIAQALPCLCTKAQLTTILLSSSITLALVRAGLVFLLVLGLCTAPALANVATLPCDVLRPSLTIPALNFKQVCCLTGCIHADL